MEHFSHTIIASAIGGFVSELISSPLCTTKTVFVTDTNFTRVSQAVSQIYNRGGLREFYRAAGPAIVSNIVSSSSKFSIYTICKSSRNTSNGDILNNSLNGIIAGIMGSTMSQPIDVWKIHKQRNEPLNVKKNGLKMFWNGYRQTLIKASCLNSMLYPLNDFYQSCGLARLESQILTACTTTTILYPVEFIRTNKMAATKVNFGWNVLKYYKGIGLQYPLNIIRFVTQMQTIYFIQDLLK
jgi:hypothetical protein